MEIRNPLTALPVPIGQPRRETHASGAQSPKSPVATESPSAQNGTGLTEYISRGELVEDTGLSDYRDLLRAARQQQAVPGGSTGRADNGPTPYVARALSAYQANTTDDSEDVQKPRIDSRV